MRNKLAHSLCGNGVPGKEVESAPSIGDCPESILHAEQALEKESKLQKNTCGERKRPADDAASSTKKQKTNDKLAEREELLREKADFLKEKEKFLADK